MFIQKLLCVWFRRILQTFKARHRFSAFWLRSKCSICSYQLNIWYGGHVPPSILNWFLQGDEVQELAPALSRVGLALQYRQDRPTSPLTPQDHHHCCQLVWQPKWKFLSYCKTMKNSQKLSNLSRAILNWIYQILVWNTLSSFTICKSQNLE